MRFQNNEAKYKVRVLTLFNTFCYYYSIVIEMRKEQSYSFELLDAW